MSWLNSSDVPRLLGDLCGEDLILNVARLGVLESSLFLALVVTETVIIAMKVRHEEAYLIDDELKVVEKKIEIRRTSRSLSFCHETIVFDNFLANVKAQRAA